MAIIDTLIANLKEKLTKSEKEEKMNDAESQRSKVAKPR